MTGATTNPRLDPGTKVGHFEIRRFLGEGGMGSVYEAVQASLDRRVALKFLRRERASDPIAVERFRREGRFGAAIRHPNVVEILDVQWHEGAPFLVMEYLEGEDLQRRLSRRGPLGSAEAADIFVEVCAALVACHDAGIVHRDLKPSNIFLAPGVRRATNVKLMDFGVARHQDRDRLPVLTKESSLVGSPAYVAPERWGDPSVATPQTDQFSVGVSLYEALTGRLPFPSDSLPMLMAAMVQGDGPPHVADVALGVPARLSEIVDRALARESADRFPDMEALGTALLPFCTEAMQRRWTPLFAAKRIPSVVESGTGTKLHRARVEALAAMADPRFSLPPGQSATRSSAGSEDPPAVLRRRRVLWAAAATAGLASAALLLRMVTDSRRASEASAGPPTLPPPSATPRPPLPIRMYPFPVDGGPARQDVFEPDVGGSTRVPPTRLPASRSVPHRPYRVE